MAAHFQSYWRGDIVERLETQTVAKMLWGKIPTSATYSHVALDEWLIALYCGHS